VPSSARLRVGKQASPLVRLPGRPEGKPLLDKYLTLDYQMCERRYHMRTKTLPKAVRRSVALSRQLVEQVSALAPPDLRQNFNRLVTVALQEFAARQTAHTFEEAMAHMAADPTIRAECAAIGRDFAVAETDGRKDD